MVQRSSLAIAIGRAWFGTWLQHELLDVEKGREGNLRIWMLENGNEQAHLDSLGRRVRSSDHSKGYHRPIRQPLPPGTRNGPKMEHSRVNVAQGHTTRTECQMPRQPTRNAETRQAKLPTNATNLSRSAAPAQLIKEQRITIPNLKKFLYHLTRGSRFPLLS